MNSKRTDHETTVLALKLGAEGVHEIQALVMTVSIGLCRAIACGSTSAAFACYRFFDPALVKLLQEAGADPELVEAIELGLELEDVERLIPERIQAAASEIEARLLHVMKRSMPERAQEWLLRQEQ